MRPPPWRGPDIATCVRNSQRAPAPGIVFCSAFLHRRRDPPAESLPRPLQTVTGRFWVEAGASLAIAPTGHLVGFLTGVNVP
jgi:hypothetical protein